MTTLTKATASQAAVAYSFIDEARRHQREQGFIQWRDDSPNLETVQRDIALGRGCLLMYENEPVGYLCIDFNGEPAYEQLNGKWLSGQKYAAVHRVALGDNVRGKGLSRDMFRLVRELCAENGIHSIRIDTHEQNKKMQHVLDREGFVYCGIVMYDIGPRLAYELYF